MKVIRKFFGPDGAEVPEGDPSACRCHELTLDDGGRVVSEANYVAKTPPVDAKSNS
jgi:hypothetical protein